MQGMQGVQMQKGSDWQQMQQAETLVIPAWSSADVAATAAAQQHVKFAAPAAVYSIGPASHRSQNTHPRDRARHPPGLQSRAWAAQRCPGHLYTGGGRAVAAAGCCRQVRHGARRTRRARRTRCETWHLDKGAARRQSPRAHARARARARAHARARFRARREAARGRTLRAAVAPRRRDGRRHTPPQQQLLVTA